MNNNLLYTIYTNFFKIEENKIKNPVDITKYSKHLIGIYDNSVNIWYNSWCLHNIPNTEINLAKGLLKHLIDDENYFSNRKKNINDVFIRTFICNSKIYITEKKTQLDLIIAIFLFYTKIYDYEVKKINNLFYYYALKNDNIL